MSERTIDRRKHSARSSHRLGMSLDTLNQFIAGTWKSNPSGNKGSFGVRNQLDIAIRVVRMDQSGNLDEDESIGPGNTNSISARVGDVFVVLDKQSGAWIRSIKIDPNDLGSNVNVEASDLINLDAKLFSTPRFVDKEPAGPTLVMVGIGRTNGRVVTESLFWQTEPGVFIPAGVEFVDEAVSETVGTTLTETESRSLATELGISFTAEANVFLATVSSTISASVTSTSTFTRSLAITQSRTTTVTTRFTGVANKSSVVFRFQLVQVVNVFKDGALKSTLENALQRYADPVTKTQ